MKKLASYLTLIFVITFLLNSYNVFSQSSQVNSNTEFETLVTYLETNGDFINSDISPALISPEEVKKNLKNPNPNPI